MVASPIRPGGSSVSSKVAAWVLAFAIIIEISLARPLLLRDLGPNEIKGFTLFGILQLPYVLSLAILLFGKIPMARDLARGIAMAVSTTALLVGSILALGLAFFRGWIKDDPANYLPLLQVICCNVFVFVASIFSSSGHRRAFSIAYIVTGIYCLLIPSTMGSAWDRQRKNIEDASMMKFAAARGLPAMVACLHDSKLRNSSLVYPSSLQSIGGAPPCSSDFAHENPLVGYTLRYIPLRAPDTNQVSGFQLVATPTGSKQRGLEPLLADDSGMIAELVGWSNSEQKPHMRAIFSEGDGIALVAAAKSFADKDPDHRLPRTFDDLVGPSSVLQSHGPNFKLGTKFQSGYFLMEYFPPTAQNPARFSVSKTCTSYGADCLRSYLFESSGEIRFTAERGSATNNDPVISVACLIQGECPDLAWPAQ